MNDYHPNDPNVFLIHATPPLPDVSRDPKPPIWADANKSRRGKRNKSRRGKKAR